MLYRQKKSLYVIMMTIYFGGISSTTVSLYEILYINYISTFHMIIILYLCNHAEIAGVSHIKITPALSK